MESKADLSYPILVITPFERPDAELTIRAARSQVVPILDLGCDVNAADSALAKILDKKIKFGVRVSEGCSNRLTDLLGNQSIATIVLSSPAEMERLSLRNSQANILVQVVSEAEAGLAKKLGADGLIAKGCESGGRIGDFTAFVLLQLLMQKIDDLPIWVQGGVGLHTAAACIVGGAQGIVLDSQLACLEESSLSSEIKQTIARMDGSETIRLSGYRFHKQPDLLPAEFGRLLQNHPLAEGSVSGCPEKIFPIGQDVAFAGSLAKRFKNIHNLVDGFYQAISSQIGQAKAIYPLGPGAPLADMHGCALPIVQGPMSRVSDQPAFAQAVSQAGGIPFVALAMVRGSEIEQILQKTAHLTRGHPWGVGLLGFIPPDLYQEQLQVIERYRPPVALIAGGRPAQARALEEIGIPTYLHVPSPGLLDMFLKDGARRFIFEGRECGGHVGPRSSFVLWESQVEKLLAFETPEEVSVLFAGGIHDARSAAMVSTLAAPLMARGTKIGILMGSAYLFTKEAVETGIILPGFQEVIRECKRTVLLETGPGHASRCAETEFVNAFQDCYTALLAEGQDPEQIWATLEELNLGRLRIAAKGVQHLGRLRDLKDDSSRHDDRFIKVDQNNQRKEGMFMIGQVAALQNQSATVAELHSQVSQGAQEYLSQVPQPETNADPARPTNVAIVGMACIFPEAPDIDSYWRNIVAGKENIKEVEPERWNPDTYFEAAGTCSSKTPSKWGGFLPEIEIDPIEYGIPPKSMAATDPVQLLALETAKRALQDAGYDKKPFRNDRTAVIFGAQAGTDLAGAYGFRALYPTYLGDLPEELDQVLPSLTEDSFPGVLSNIIAGRIANRLDLSGVNYTVDAACASSLAALDIACKELNSFTSDMVLCGGADLHNSINDYLMFASVHALSPTGHCRAFDSKADGIVLGEGVGVVVLKRLTDAVRDGDRIYSVIKSIAGSGDGRSPGLTVPHKQGQIRVLQRAYHQAGTSANEVSLVEAHGTGTVLGDRTEIATLTEVYTAAGAQPGSCSLGSVKSQIGHTKCAAGLAGLIKTALAIYHKCLPPTLNLNTPNPAYEPNTNPFSFCSKPRPWVRKDRLAAVSAFGFGGANYHAVLAADENQSEAIRGMKTWTKELFIFRGQNQAQALETVKRLSQLLDTQPHLRLKDLAGSLSTCQDGPVQVALVAENQKDLKDKLAVVISGCKPANQVYYSSKVAGQVAFLFPGQGSQRPGMLADLFVAFPELGHYLSIGKKWLDVLYPADAFSPEARIAQQQTLADTRVAQPVLGIADLAIAHLLREFGVAADMLAGHSYGELAALCWAGGFSPATLLSLSAARGQALHAAAADTAGSMAAVRACADDVERYVAAYPEVVVANYNAPLQNVISGPSEAINKIVAELAQQGIASQIIPVSCAFHSPQMEVAKEPFSVALSAAEIKPLTKPVWSNTTAKLYPADPGAIRNRLLEHLTNPVRFTEQIQAMYSAGARIFVEVGPGRVLTGLATKALTDKQHVAIASDIGGQDAVGNLLDCLAQIAVLQIPISTDKLFTGRDCQPIDLCNPPNKSKTLWQVSGHRAQPIDGCLPENALQPVCTPVTCSPRSAEKIPKTDAVVVEYLKSMREMIRTQREVLLKFLGTESSEINAEIGSTITDRQADMRPAPPKEEPPAVEQDLTIDQMLLEIISDRTGYPIDMLDLDLDLAADLSIDSIKRIEILGELSKRMGFATQDTKQRDELVEELAAQKTIRNILDWLQKHQDSDENESEFGNQPDQTKEVIHAPNQQTSNQVWRYVLSVEPAPQIVTNGVNLREKNFVITPAGSLLAQALQGNLQQSGATVQLIGKNETCPQNTDGLICLPDATDSSPSDEIERLFSLVQEALIGGVRWVLATTEMGGKFAQKLKRSKAWLPGGISGLLKTASQEWPQAKIKVVDVDPEENPEILARELCQELLADDGIVEVGYQKGERYVCKPVQAEIGNQLDMASLELDSSSVILITGGGRGITSQVARSLAVTYACKMILVGRSKLSQQEELKDLVECSDLPQLRRKLVELNSNMPPAQIDAQARKIIAEREIRATIAAVRQAGGYVEYNSIDVSDAEIFANFIDDLYARFGRIDGVIHGAGIVEDKLIRHKTVDSFKHVFDTKVIGALTLAKKIRKDVSFVVFFSSISSVFGNRGQVDYSAANHAMDQLAWSLNQQLAGRVVSINWGPWSSAGTGMVSAELEREYKNRGIGVIPLAEGITNLLAELNHPGEEAQVILMSAAPNNFHVVNR